MLVCSRVVNTAVLHRAHWEIGIDDPAEQVRVRTLWGDRVGFAESELLRALATGRAKHEELPEWEQTPDHDVLEHFRSWCVVHYQDEFYERRPYTLLLRFLWDLLKESANRNISPLVVKHLTEEI